MEIRALEVFGVRMVDVLFFFENIVFVFFEKQMSPSPASPTVN